MLQDLPICKSHSSKQIVVTVSMITRFLILSVSVIGFYHQLCGARGFVIGRATTNAHVLQIVACSFKQHESLAPSKCNLIVRHTQVSTQMDFDCELVHAFGEVGFKLQNVFVQFIFTACVGKTLSRILKP